jgi:pseudouridine-5'-phosphate glycosidase
MCAASGRDAQVRAPRVNELVELSEEVGDALERGRPVVALETTLVAHGFPAPDGVDVALESEAAVRDAGAVPATVGVLDGRIRVGLAAGELARFTQQAQKVGPRDVAACVALGVTGATTVGGTLVVAQQVGIRFLGTGGIGGAHRGFARTGDVSADLPALARASVLVVSSGTKSLLDVPATLELLETLGVPVLGYRTSTLPLFYSAAGGPAVPRRVEHVADAARVARAHWLLGGAGVLLANPPPESLDVADLIEEALAHADDSGVGGQGVTPFVLAFLHERSGGRTREVNRKLVVANAGLAGEAAVAFAAL